MAQQRRGLGRGLGALIPEAPLRADGDAARGIDPGLQAAGLQTATGAGPSASPGDPVEVFGAHYKEIDVFAVTPNPRQPRRTFDEDALDELAESIRQVGLLQPVVVRAAGPGRYELIMGERRWRAAQRAGLTEIGAIVKQTQDDDLLRDALIENLHRQQLDPLEEAAAYQQLLDDFGATHEELARKIGRSRPHISNTLRLLNLPPAVQKRVAAGVLSAGHARALLSVENPEAQERLAGRIVAEGLSVRAVEEIVAVGTEDSPPRRPLRSAARPPTAPGLRHLADRLSDLFETRVKVELGQRKGKIVVEFATIDDLERIVKAMSPEVSGPESSSSSELRPLPAVRQPLSGSQFSRRREQLIKAVAPEGRRPGRPSPRKARLEGSPLSSRTDIPTCRTNRSISMARPRRTAYVARERPREGLFGECPAASLRPGPSHRPAHFRQRSGGLSGPIHETREHQRGESADCRRCRRQREPARWTVKPAIAGPMFHRAGVGGAAGVPGPVGGAAGARPAGNGENGRDSENRRDGENRRDSENRQGLRESDGDVGGVTTSGTREDQALAARPDGRKLPRCHPSGSSDWSFSDTGGLLPW